MEYKIGTKKFDGETKISEVLESLEKENDFKEFAKESFKIKEIDLGIPIYEND